MNRPYVTVKSNNDIQALRASLFKTLPKFTGLGGVVGVTLNGGLSRGYGDFLSEIDIVLYLEDRQFRAYEAGRYPFALGITVIDGSLYDIKTASYEEEFARSFEPVALWDLSYAEILYDPEGKMAALMRQKLAPPVATSIAGGLMWSAYWSYKLAGDIWIHRQDGLQGHFMLNNAMQPLLCALFVANKEYIPHEKWLVHMSKTLEWKPGDWEVRLAGAMATGDFTTESLVERQQYIAGLWKDIDRKLCAQTDFENGLTFAQKSGYEALRKLLEKSEYTVAEWEAVSTLEALNHEPVHTLFKREGGRIVLDEAKLLSLQPEDMYVWIYQVADAARKGYRERNVQ